MPQGRCAALLCGTKRPAPQASLRGAFLQGRHRCPAIQFVQSLEATLSDVTAQVAVRACRSTHAATGAARNARSAFCPFCQKSLLDRCEHVVASWTDDAGWNYSPFEHAPLPEVPEELEGLETTPQDWLDIFGETAASVVADAYTNCGELGWKPELEDEPSLFLWMLERQGLSCDSSSWEVPSWGFSSFGNDYFSQERDRNLAAIKAEVAGLAVGLEQLFTILRARHKQPEKPPIPFPSASADNPIYKEGGTVFTVGRRSTPNKGTALAWTTLSVRLDELLVILEFGPLTAAEVKSLYQQHELHLRSKLKLPQEGGVAFKAEREMMWTSSG